MMERCQSIEYLAEVNFLTYLSQQLLTANSLPYKCIIASPGCKGAVEFYLYVVTIY